MYRSLLVPLDGSSFGEQALPVALSIARRAGATLEVVHVHAPLTRHRVPSAAAPDLDEQARKDKSAYLDSIVNRLATESKWSATFSLLDGHPPDAIHDHAAAKGIDLVVMTTHGRGPLSRFWFGSVADHLMRRLPMPVLLVRPQEQELDLAREPAFRHFLIPLDGSELAEQILEPAVDLSTIMQAELTLVRIVDPVLEFDDEFHGRRTMLMSRSLYSEVAAIRKHREQEAHDYLENVANRVRAKFIRVQARVVPSLFPAPAILKDAGDHSIDLIALATQGLGGLTRLFLGSVADKVARGADVPVLVYRPRNQS